MNNKAIFLGIALLTIALGVRAAEISGDFSLEASCLVPAKAFYALENDSGTSHTYNITSVGENSSWIYMGAKAEAGALMNDVSGKWIGSEPLVISLAAGQEEELVAFVKPQDCYVTPGNYTIKIRVSNGETIEEDISIRVISTRSVALEADESNKSVSQCGQASYSLSVENTGKSDEWVILSVQGIGSAWFSLPQTEFLLEEGATRTIPLEVQPNCTALPKGYDFTVSAEMAGTSFRASESLSLVITDMQGIEITAPELVACNDALSAGTIEIENSGRLADSLELDVTGPEWVSLDTKKVSVQEGETASIGLSFAESTAQPGSYTITVKAHSTKFNKDYVQNFDVHVKDCYSASIVSVTIDGSAASALETVCLEKNPVFVFTVHNTQENAIEVEANVKGMSASIKPAVLALEGNATGSVEVEIELEGETAGENAFSLALESPNFSVEQPQNLVVEDCYAIEVGFDGLQRQVDVNAGSEAEAVTVKLRNIGTKENTVSASVSGPSWILFDPTSIQLQPGEEKGLFLYISPPYAVREGLHKAELGLSATGFSDSKAISVNVYGGLYAELGEARVSAEGRLENLLEEIERTVEVKIEITNDSNSLLRIQDINVLGFYATHSFSEATLQPNETVEASVTLFLGKGFEEEEFFVPVQFLTDKGTLTRDVFVDLSPEPGQPNASVGLLSLGGTNEALLVAIIVIVIAIIVMIALKGHKPMQSETLIGLAKQVQDIPAQKLEEIGKAKGTRKAASKTKAKAGQKKASKGGKKK